VIVRWATRFPSGGTPDPFVMRVLRPIGGWLTGVLTSPQLMPASDGSITELDRPTNMPVRAGDLIGVDLDEGEEVGIAPHATFDSESSLFTPLLSDGKTRAPTDSGPDDFELLFNARIEPDADRDGYGDETQDRCPELAAEHRLHCRGPTVRLDLPSTSVPFPVVAGSGFRLGVSVRNSERFEYRNVSLTITLPPELSIVSVSTPCRTRPHGGTCPLGTVSGGGSIDLAVNLRATRPGGLPCLLDPPLPCVAVAAQANWTASDTRPATASTLVRILADGACANRLAEYRSGDDRLTGTLAGDRMLGTARHDTFVGGAGDDCLLGRNGNDVLRAGAGRDRLSGGLGPDRLFGDTGSDHLTGGPGRDRIEGGPGKDVIRAVDGRRDLVRCGPGHDRARIDAVDSVARCERVRRARRR
jgi:hypothetical protein